jgi:hypothetical protein
MPVKTKGFVAEVLFMPAQRKAGTLVSAETVK